MPSISTTTALIISAVAAAAGASVSAYSAVAAGENAEETGNYNKKMAEIKAKDSLDRGADQAAQIRDRARKIESTQAEGAAMSGVEINSGTPLALLTETAGLGELDALRTLNNAQREAWGYKAQGELDLYAGRNAAAAGKMNAAGTLLTAASNTYYGYRNATK